MTSEDENNLILVGIMAALAYMVYSVMNKASADTGSGSVGPLTTYNADGSVQSVTNATTGQPITNLPNEIDFGTTGAGW